MMPCDSIDVKLSIPLTLQKFQSVGLDDWVVKPKIEARLSFHFHGRSPMSAAPVSADDILMAMQLCSSSGPHYTDRQRIHDTKVQRCISLAGLSIKAAAHLRHVERKEGSGAGRLNSGTRIHFTAERPSEGGW